MRPNPISEQESRVDEAYRHLLAYIEREDLPEGARLPSEVEFVDRLGLSRTSIREALARIRAEGRAVSRRGSGTFTLRPQSSEMVRLSAIDSIQDLIDWHEFRIALESEVAALSAERRSPHDLAEMQRAQEELLLALESDHAGREDAAFHRSIAFGARNAKLLDAVGALTAHIFRWSNVARERGILTLAQRREVIAVEHGEILSAIADGKPDLARAAARRHLLNGRARLLSSMPR